MGTSLDLQQKNKENLMISMANAIKSGDAEQMSKAYADFAQYVQEQIKADQNAYTASAVADATVLASRGYRQLTNEETKYYNALGDALKSTDVKMALQNIEVAFPETVIDAVMDDIKQAHPLLDKIKFVNTHGAIKMLVNIGDVAAAAWGKLTDAKKQELSGNIKEIDAQLLKLISYIPVPKAIVDLGPVWLDSYVRSMLSESVALGMEIGVVSGDGDEQPIGMDKIVGKNAVISAGKYKQKPVIKVKNFGKVEFGKLLAKMSKNSETGASRVVSDVLLIVNPADYFTKIMPASTVLTPSGQYAKDVFPYPVDVVCSAAVTEGQAVMGIGSRYFLCAGMQKGGKITYSDDVQFLEDNRVFLAKMYGNGMALDDNAFLLLDISEIEEMRYSVTTWTEQLDADAEVVATTTRTTK